MTYRIVVPISGGKDSQACLQIALDHAPQSEVLGLFCDTQFEHPKTYAHVDFMRDYYGVTIERITAGSVLEKVLKHGRFPGGGARHCTEELKIVPSKKFYKQLAEAQGGFEVWLGMRTEESNDRATRYAGKIDDALYAPHEVMRKYPKYLAKLGVMMALPVIDWSTSEVFALLDGKENPLYADGFERVGCFPCLAAGDKHKRRAFEYDEVGRKHYADVQTIEIQTGKSVWTSKGIRCAMCSI
jgi:3'-phosphoadenosine 5'-phosphosulfate sulfotransferase (PAPS reductase)/FAD synthetase